MLLAKVVLGELLRTPLEGKFTYLALRYRSAHSASLYNPLGTPPRFETRPHELGGLGLHERKHAAIGGDEYIDLRTIPKGDGACAVRLDRVREGVGLLTSNLPVEVRGIDAFCLTVAVKDCIPCKGERDLLIIALDFDPIKGEQIRALKRGLGALRPGGVLILGISGSNGS
jgi:hypothetical protein